MTPAAPPRHRRWVGLVLALAGCFSCGDALSGLEIVQRSARDRYPMQLQPDWGRRGDSLRVEVELDPALVSRLAGAGAYPIAVAFGEGTSLRSFGSDDQGHLWLDILISPLAEEGERSPRLEFMVKDKLCEASGSFWILPALAGS